MKTNKKEKKLRGNKKEEEKIKDKNESKLPKDADAKNAPEAPAQSASGAQISSDPQNINNKKKTESKDKDKQKKKKNALRLPRLSVKAKRALIFIAVMAGSFVVFISLVIGIIALDNAVGRDTDFRVTVSVVDRNAKKHNSTTRRSSVYKSGSDVVYVNMNLVTEMLGVVTIGDSERMQYILRSDREKYVLLENGSRSAEINGVEVALPGPVFIDGANVYVPEAFFTYYCSGIEVHYSVYNKRLTITISPDSPFVFAMMQVAPQPKINEPLDDLI